MPIRKKLYTYIILMATLPLIILGAALYAYLSGELTGRSVNNLKLVTGIQSKNLTEIINGEKLQAKLMAQQDSIKTLLKESVNELDVSHIGANTPGYTVAKDILAKAIASDQIRISYVADIHGRVILSTDEYWKGRPVTGVDFNQALLNKPVVTNVSPAPFNLGSMIELYMPVVDENNKVIGVIGNVLDLNYFQRNVFSSDLQKLGKTGYFYLVDSNGVIISYPDAKRIGQSVENSSIKEVVANLDKYENTGATETQYTYRGEERTAAFEIIPDINWLLVASQATSEINSSIIVIIFFIAGTTAILLFLSILISLKLSRLVTRPVEKLTMAMKKSADGDLTVKSEINSKDEFGSLSTSFNIMMEKLNLSYEELSSTYEQLSATEEELRAQYDELQHSEEALRNSEDRYKLALENANDAIWEWDVSAGRFYTSDKWEGIIGGNYNDKSKLSNILEMVIYPEDLNMVRRELYRHIHGESPAFKVEFRLKAKEDGYKWAYARGKAIRDDSGKILKVTGSVSDISEAKNAARKIEHMAYYDSLTGLPNRAFFINKLDEQIDAAKSKGSRGAIMYIDVDNFKNINDTLGHEYGDMLLKELSRRLDSIKGEGDTIYRLGGDEFGILRTTEEGCRSIRDFSKEVLGAIMENFDLSGKNVFISASIGVALYPEEGDSSGLLMKNADMAMYKAKEKGKNRYELFDNNMYNTLEKKLRIEEILRDALSNSGFYLLYQPQYDILTRKVVGFEALLRLRQEKYGFISPGEFIPIAEESGLIIQIGEWVLREACRKNVSWRKLGYEYESISVNISSVQIQSPGFVEMVEAVLKETGLPPKWLELEITESVLMQSIKYSIEVLNRLKDMGIRLSLDDFGTGYSSLNYLKMMPMNTLKMDKTFIDGICLNKKEEIIADAIVDMAHTMELTVIAEGVETEEQLNLLSKHSCDRVQGFLLNKPLTEEKAEELLKVTSGT